eukprot:TRINITY_DN21773_c0_g3_i1.p1 TRINITY_DN21773_c0_g3~~TRINITY_DN21773_c0_g3_i1.p1  ORF type:complete len:344 (+),score=64.26 TRINITY_DN21773_c0_g3_i1:74-1105(+)
MSQMRNVQLSNQLVETPVSSSFGFQPVQQGVQQTGFGVTCSPGLMAGGGPSFEASTTGSFGTGMAMGYNGNMPPPPVPVPAAGSARSSLSSEASITSPHILTHYRDSQGSCASSFTHDPYSYGDLPVASPAMGLATSNRRSSFMAADPPQQAQLDQADVHSTTSSSCGDSISTTSCYSGVPAVPADMVTQQQQQQQQQVVTNVRTVSQVIQIPHAPNGNPRSRHHITRAGPNQRFGAWIRGNAITNVVPSGPADQAGLIVGMRILFVDGQPADAATVSSNIRKTWKDVGSLELIVETQLAGTRSKRSLAKARARARSRALAEGEGAGMSDAVVHPVAPAAATQ